ncbi:MAG: peptide chain release factor-like protein [candidate division KSB1 bacterium]|nr:peptide chain release factor-like protein [candidate division KSB1 bacterium]
MPESGKNNIAKIKLAISTLKDEVEITAFKSGGPGGQHKNKTESAVRIKHVPTGIIVTASESRSQFKNRSVAWQRLIEKLAKRHRKQKPRLPTQPTRAAKKERLEEKSRLAAKKQRRHKVRFADEV